MEISFSSNVVKKLKEIKAERPKTFKRIQKQLMLFAENPIHNSLRTHKLKGRLKNSWSISIEGNLRMLYRFDADGVVFFEIGNHDEVYKG